jgi:hypothetical protein
MRENCSKIRKLQRILAGNDCVYGLVFDYNIEEDKVIRQTLVEAGIIIVNTRIRLGMRLQYTEGLPALFSSRVTAFKSIGCKQDIRHLCMALNKVEVIKGRFLLWGIVFESVFITIENYNKIYEVGISAFKKEITILSIRSYKGITKVIMSMWFYIINLILKRVKADGNHKSTD